MRLPASLAPRRARLRPPCLVRTACTLALGVGLVGCGSAVATPSTDGISRATSPSSLARGHFPDPYPVDEAKYLEADGQLYLVYSRHLSNPPEGADGIVAQLMVTPTEPAGSSPVTLLAPTETGGGLRSERATSDPDDHFALVETGNITEIVSVWVLVYSTGTYDHTDYKLGVAYADSPLPQGGYRKVLVPDPQRVWGSSGDEVDYLLQAQEPGWPHYVGATVQAPGVGSILHLGSAWYLVFAGYPPSTRTGPGGRVRRRPQGPVLRAAARGGARGRPTRRDRDRRAARRLDHPRARRLTGTGATPPQPAASARARIGSLKVRPNVATTGTRQAQAVTARAWVARWCA